MPGSEPPRIVGLKGTSWCLFGFVLMVMLTGGATRAYASGCPNEALRAELRSTQLPECRAYELVSPAAKNGWSVQVLSANGSRVLMSSLGSFAGGSQALLFNNFIAERTSSGWDTSAFVDPAGLVTPSANNPLAESPDLTEGLFEYRSALGPGPDERNLYVWHLPEPASPVKGKPTPVEVGPAFPRTAVESAPPGTEGELSAYPSVSGASLANGHVLFTIRGPSSQVSGLNNLLPVDQTVPDGNLPGFASLYEYSGTNNAEPKLVGVRNKGALKRNGEAQLIGQCGTSVGFPLAGSFIDDGFGLGEAYNAISSAGDASRVFFTSAAATLGPEGNACTPVGAGRGPSVDELYVRVNASETVAISEPSLSVPGRQCSGVCREDEEDLHKRSAGIFRGASEDGSKVFFLTNQPLVNGDGDNTPAPDLYEAEIGGEPGNQEVTGLVQVSHDSNLGEAAEVQGVARVSEDGSHVYFVARGVLTAGANPVGAVARPGADNFYVYNTLTKRLAFIGDLCSGAEASGVIVDPQCPVNLNSTPPPSGVNDLRDWQQEDTRPIDATPNGRFVVFASYANLTPGDTSTAQQAFEYDAEAETLVRVSEGQNGFNNNGNTEVYDALIVHPSYTPSQNPAPQLTSVSNDGSVVVFQSSDALTPHAVEGSGNVYEYHGGQVSLISDGQDRAINGQGRPSTFLLGMDGSGQDIFFTTADQLVPQDGDTQEDVYDARVEGGIAPPPARAACEGDGCQGAATSSPSFLTAGSASQTAGENLAEAPLLRPAVRARIKSRKAGRCSKSKRLSRGKCAKVKRRGVKRARVTNSRGRRR